MGRCCYGIWAEVWLDNGMAMVRVVGGWPMDFWDPWCRDAIGVVVGKLILWLR
jgi:hypothetical protein